MSQKIEIHLDSTLEGCRSQVRSVLFFPPSTLVSETSRKVVKIWNMATLECMRIKDHAYHQRDVNLDVQNLYKWSDELFFYFRHEEFYGNDKSTILVYSIDPDKEEVVKEFNYEYRVYGVLKHDEDSFLSIHKNGSMIMNRYSDGSKISDWPWQTVNKYSKFLRSKLHKNSFYYCSSFVRRGSNWFDVQRFNWTTKKVEAIHTRKMKNVLSVEVCVDKIDGEFIICCLESSSMVFIHPGKSILFHSSRSKKTIHSITMVGEKYGFCGMGKGIFSIFHLEQINNPVWLAERTVHSRNVLDLVPIDINSRRINIVTCSADKDIQFLRIKGLDVGEKEENVMIKIDVLERCGFLMNENNEEIIYGDEMTSSKEAYFEIRILNNPVQLSLKVFKFLFPL